MSSALATRIAEEHAAAAASLPADVVSREKRRSAIDTLTTQGLPTSRDENWKYANLRLLEKVRFVPLAADFQGRDAAQAETSSNAGKDGEGLRLTREDLPASVEGYARYTFVDGVFIPALSSELQRTGIEVKSLRGTRSPVLPAAPVQTVATAQAYTTATAQATDSSLSPFNGSKDARFALLNDAFATDGASIRVSAGIDACIELVFIASVDLQTGSSYPRVELQVEAGARLGLIERHISVGGGTNFVNASIKVDIARGATVNHYRLQESGVRAVWFDTLAATLAQDATYRLHGVNLGGLSARSTVHVQLAGERADAAISIASLGDQQQVQDTFVLVEHAAPRACSEQTFRGISAGRARVAFNGMVVVRKDAVGTDSQQSLRGLLAGADAEIDVRPQLEIYTDDVRCAHGATAGKLDDNMLFYLLSRGIDPATAQRLLKWAFLEDVVAKIEVPELRRQIERSLAGQMQDALPVDLTGAGLEGAPNTAGTTVSGRSPRDRSLL